MGQPGKKGLQNIHLDFLMGQDKSLAPGRNCLFRSPSLGILQVQCRWAFWPHSSS